MTHKAFHGLFLAYMPDLFLQLYPHRHPLLQPYWTAPRSPFLPWDLTCYFLYWSISPPFMCWHCHSSFKALSALSAFPYWSLLIQQNWPLFHMYLYWTWHTPAFALLYYYEFKLLSPFNYCKLLVGRTCTLFAAGLWCSSWFIESPNECLMNESQWPLR